MRARFGVRADVLSYDIEDRLGNFAPLTRPSDSFLPGFRRSAMGVAWGPRASLELKPLEGVTVLAAYGEGYGSPQARVLEDSERAPFTKVRSADLGVRIGVDDLRASAREGAGERNGWQMGRRSARLFRSSANM